MLQLGLIGSEIVNILLRSSIRVSSICPLLHPLNCEPMCKWVALSRHFEEGKAALIASFFADSANSSIDSSFSHHSQILSPV